MLTPTGRFSELDHGPSVLETCAPCLLWCPSPRPSLTPLCCCHCSMPVSQGSVSDPLLFSVFHTCFLHGLIHSQDLSRHLPDVPYTCMSIVDLSFEPWTCVCTSLLECLLQGAVGNTPEKKATQFWGPFCIRKESVSVLLSHIHEHQDFSIIFPLVQAFSALALLTFWIS